MINFAAIEKSLGAKLPESYISVLAALLDSVPAKILGRRFRNQLFLTTKKILQFNAEERRPDSGLNEAYPDWWQTYLLIGTNDGGDYYCLRWDADDGPVWVIGTDCDGPFEYSASLSGYIQEIEEEEIEQQRREKEIAERQQQYVAELKAHRRFAEEASDSENAIKWLDVHSGIFPIQLLDRLPARPSIRKMRLFGIANCRLIEGLEDDAVCRDALELVERAIQEDVDQAVMNEMAARLRDRLRALENAYKVYDATTARRLKYGTESVFDLFEDERAYVTRRGNRPGEPGLMDVAREVALAQFCLDAPNEHQIQLLREVFGNPFAPVKFDSTWVSDEAVRLAEGMLDTAEFKLMPELGDALERAGCVDPRVLEHCRRSSGHIRGCWVIDGVLGLDSTPANPPRDYSCSHPSIDSGALKEQLMRFGITGDLSVHDARSREEFAGWLEQQGDDQWAQYLRVRGQLDGVPSQNYAEALERSFELSAGLSTGKIELDYLRWTSYEHVTEKWWEDGPQGREYGLPFQVNVSPTDGPPMSTLLSFLDELVAKSPFRGMEIGHHSAQEFQQLLSSCCVSSMQSLEFENARSETTTEVSERVRILCESNIVENLRRLTADHLIKSDADALELARTSFRNLRQLRIRYGAIQCSPSSIDMLMRTDWFQNLQQFSAEFSESCGDQILPRLAELPNLHSLDIHRFTDQQICGLDSAGTFHALKRLRLARINLTGKSGEAIRGLRCPQLTELYLQACKAGPRDVIELLRSPLCENVQVLTLSTQLDDRAVAELAQCGFAARLRILRLRVGDENCVGSLSSLSDSPFVKEGCFPRLSTLDIENPYQEAAKQDVAEFLAGLTLPELRQFRLKNCEFGDAAAAAIQRNPSFAKLRMLNLAAAFETGSQLTPTAALSLFRSQQLMHLVELSLTDFPLMGDIAFLADHDVLPNLRSASIWGCKAPSEVQRLFEQVRPAVYVGS